MGVSLTVNSYKKNNDHIISHLKSIGTYDVKLDKVEAFNTASSITFWDTIYCFQELAWGKWDVLSQNEIFISRSKIGFFDYIPSRMSDENIISIDNEIVGPMFDPKQILEVTEVVLNTSDWLIETFSSYSKSRIKENDEINNLTQLRTLLTQAIEEDLIIGLSIG